MNRAEDLREGIVFQNVGEHTIPPFACMERVGHKLGKDKYPKMSDFEYYLNRLTYNGRFNTSTPVIWCDRPSIAAEYIQNHAAMAFNGGTAVPPGKFGSCSIGQFPARALVFPGGINARQNLAILRDEFALHAVGVYNGSAYYPVFDTGQRVPVASKIARDSSASVMRVIGNNKPNGPVEGRGTFGLKGISEEYIRLIIEQTITSSDGDVALNFPSVPIFGDKFLTINTPGRYSFRIVARIQPLAITPSDVYSIPFRVVLIPQLSDDRLFFRSTHVGDRGRISDQLPILTLPKYYYQSLIDDPDQTPQVISPLSPPTEGEVEKWPRAQLTYSDTINVMKAPMTLVLRQDLSPYVLIGNESNASDPDALNASNGSMLITEHTAETEKIRSYNEVNRNYFGSYEMQSYIWNGALGAYNTSRGAGQSGTLQQTLLWYVEDSRFPNPF